MYSMARGTLPHHSTRASSRREKMHRAGYLHCMRLEPKRQSYLTALPTELLLEIVINVPERHAHTGCVIEASNLAALSRASRTLRAVALPIMHREVILTSEKQLRSFQTMPKELLECVRYVAQPFNRWIYVYGVK